MHNGGGGGGWAARRKEANLLYVSSHSPLERAYALGLNFYYHIIYSLVFVSDGPHTSKLDVNPPYIIQNYISDRYQIACSFQTQ